MISPSEPAGTCAASPEQRSLGAARRDPARALRPPTAAQIPPLLIARPSTRGSVQRVAEHAAPAGPRRAARPSLGARRSSRSSTPPPRGAPRPDRGWPTVRRRPPTTTGTRGPEPGRGAGSRGRGQPHRGGSTAGRSCWRRDPGERQRLGVPVAAVDARQPGPRGDRVVDSHLPVGEPEPRTYSLMPSQRWADANTAGWRSRQPDQLDQGRHGVDRRAGPPVQRLSLRGGPPKPLGLEVARRSAQVIAGG